MALNLHAPSRRELMLGSGALFAWAHLPRLARAEGRDPRLLTIVLRGALDGLAVVAPVGDPDWVKLRGDRALVLDGKTPALPLDSFFALNAAMPNLHRLFQAKEALIVHAVCHAIPRAIAFRWPGRARKRPRQARQCRIPAGSTARSAPLNPNGASARRVAKSSPSGR